MLRATASATFLFAALLLGCSDADGAGDVRTAGVAGAADALGSGSDDLPAEDVERGRHDRSWRQHADVDRRGRLAERAARDGESVDGADRSRADGRSAPSGARSPGDGGAAADTAQAESWDDIGAGPLQVDERLLPLHGEVEGPSVLAVQVLLDRVRFSPGILDGYWGKNTEKAVYWLQSERGLEPTGQVDRETLELLRREAAIDGPLSREIRLSEALVEGPFVAVPSDVYEQAAMDCLCYESLGEKLAERFHTTREVLTALNPGVQLDGLSAGASLVVPDHGGPVDSLGARETGRPGSVDRIVISDGGHYLHALGADGGILYHFPSTLGSDYAPSPTGDYAVNAIARDPTWHYQPDILTGEDPSKEDAIVPPGPNNPVGVVWMDLTKPHYGIHGTAAPSTIGYATSHGCVRLTNWDVAFLADRAGVGPETPVEFRQTAGRGDG